ncbi:MAG TPA: DUF72 domain-containing protein, partial [Desulfobacteraceae bacterium]|nr:DUF72 domain-containing protein [Desulfobacteraceae bacterium]
MPEKTDALNRFDFRGLNPLISIGTASDRYAGWIGQIYTAERYHGRITSRNHTVGGKSFSEKVLPVESVSEYFEHFRILELDFTFYNTLIDAEGKQTPTYRTLSAYARYMPERGRLLLKVPQIIFARKLRRKERHEENENYLNPEIFRERFYEPAMNLVSPWLSGFIFEQEYQRSAERMHPDDFAGDMDRFFSSIPPDDRYHVEIRTSALLMESVFDVMKAHGVGQVLSHWTWLPSLSAQFEKSGGMYLNRKRGCVIRLMTPRGMRYEQAYHKAHPFDSLIPGMLDPKMIPDTVRIM